MAPTRQSWKTGIICSPILVFLHLLRPLKTKEVLPMIRLFQKRSTTPFPPPTEKINNNPPSSSLDVLYKYKTRFKQPPFFT